MHSTIFQITKTRVEKENFLNEDTLMQGDNSHFDYCAEMDDKVRKEEIDYLVNHILPKGMFELTSEDTYSACNSSSPLQSHSQPLCCSYQRK